MKLYEISAALRELSESELDFEVLKDTIDELEISRHEKLDNIFGLIKEKLADAKILKEHEDDIKARRKRLEKDVDWLKSYALENMKATSVPKFESPLHRASIRTSVSVDVYDLNLLPDELCKLSREANKTAIKDLLDNGMLVHGAALLERESLVIK